MNNKSSNSQTIIAEDVQIDGDMTLSGNITIYGEVRGSVSTDGAIQLAKRGKIFGDVKAIFFKSYIIILFINKIPFL